MEDEFEKLGVVHDRGMAEEYNRHMEIIVQENKQQGEGCGSRGGITGTRKGL